MVACFRCFFPASLCYVCKFEAMGCRAGDVFLRKLSAIFRFFLLFLFPALLQLPQFLRVLPVLAA